MTQHPLLHRVLSPLGNKTSDFLHFNDFASKVQIKRYEKKPIEVEEQILVDEPEAEPEAILPVVSVLESQQQLKQQLTIPTIPTLSINQLSQEEDPGPSISQRDLRDLSYSSSSKVSVTPPRSVILPLHDRISSKPSSNVGIPLPAYAPMFAVDQTSWNDITNRVSLQECEVEKLKGTTKRYQLQMLQMNQNIENQRIGINDDVKKSEDQMTERLYLSEFQCKKYTDKRITDETGDIQQKIKILENQSRRDGWITTATGWFLGILMLSYLLQCMNTLVQNPAISYYDISDKTLPPS